MKKFIGRSIVFLAIIGASIYLCLLQADGYTDAFYMRFTSPPQEAMILGTSRAAQALQPGVFKEILDREIFNYAFTATNSPYGPVYLESIKRKLKNNTEDGLFILAVDPWTISSKSEDPNDTLSFREKELFLANTTNVSSDPNLEYLIESFSGNYMDIFINKYKSSLFLHENGWLEVTVRMDEAAVTERTQTKIKSYQKERLDYAFSDVRLDYLQKTITFLRQHGRVYVVRLPVDPAIMEIENQLMPDFEQKIAPVKTLCDAYLDLSDRNAEFAYTDGNHLYKDAGQEVSGMIARWVLNTDTYSD